MDRVDDRYFWDVKDSTVTEDGRSWRRCWFMAERSPEFAPPPIADVRALAGDFHGAIEAMLAFAHEYRKHEQDHIERLETAAVLLSAIVRGDESVPISEGLRELYPKTGYSRDRMLLGAATFESNIFGGMGSWNGWGGRTPEGEARFQAVNEAYWQLVGPCMTAASMAEA